MPEVQNTAAGPTAGSQASVPGLGDAPLRVEDERLLRGRGCFLDDHARQDLTDPTPSAVLLVVRSPHAHARIRNLDTRAACALPGVYAVLHGEHLRADGLQPLLPTALVNPHSGEPFAFEPQSLLALERVRYVGEPVAIVLAEDLARAQDGAELVQVDYEPLPAVSDAREALADGAPRLSEQVPGNQCLHWRHGDPQATRAAFERAAHLVEVALHNHRIVQSPMEPRGAIGRYDAERERFDLRVSTQNVHVIAEHVARALAVPVHSVRLHAADVGGGFGVRNFPYPEYALVLWAARRLRRTVRWLNSRSDGFVSDHQARDVHTRAELALDGDGRFLGLRVHSIFNAGAYMSGAACGVPTGQYLSLPGSVYDIPCLDVEVRVALSNTVPIGVTRGPGFAETVDVLERLIDKAARHCGLDRLQLRRLNLVGASRMPWRNAVGTVVDSGDFHGCLEAAMERADLAGFEQRRARAAAAGLLRGLGVVMHVKATGGNPQENVRIEFRPDRVLLTTGTQAIGQGHETTFRQIVGSLLGLPPERIEYHGGDTALIAMGGGHGSSRATYMAGTAMHMAAGRIVARGRELAAQRLQAERHEVVFESGRFVVPGSGRAIGLLELAAESGAALDTYQLYTRESMTYPNGCHVAEVEIDPETGRLELVAYHAVDDYGELVNPMVATAQVHGAIAQGVGQALLERAVYDPRNAQPLTGSFLDYALPRADDLPPLDVAFDGRACRTNPLGVKGCGESGAIAGFPAINNAICDALSAHGVDDFEGPATAYRIWRLLNAAARERTTA